VTVAQILPFYHETQNVRNAPCILNAVLLKLAKADRGAQVEEVLEVMYF